MRIEEFDYTLPQSLIAQYPSPQRDESRLMVLYRSNGKIEHCVFRDIINYLRPGDLLVMNNTRVLPARLIGKKETGGKFEALLIPPTNGLNGEYEVLIKGSGKVKRRIRVQFDQDLYGEVTEVKDGKGKIRFSYQMEIMDLLQKIGHIPLPPYIKRGDEPLDKIRYQTVIAERKGSIAAPTAALHFTQPLLQSIKNGGVNIVTITLHIGIGTFTPVKSEEVEDHRMETEWIEVSEETAKEIAKTKRLGGKIIAVGTTTAKALESFSDLEGRVKPGEKFSSLFIYPPYRFRVIDGLCTNFHLPKSTLIMLVSAFVDKNFLMKAYEEAIHRKYRFYSYGDAMLII